MHLLHRTRSAYRSLIIVALGALLITGCQQGTSTPPSVEVDPVLPGGIEVAPSFDAYPALGATAVVGEDRAAVEYPTYYLYILDRDGVPVQRFACEGQYISRSDHGRYCAHPDGTFTMVSEVVPSLMTTEQLPLKGEQPAPEQ